jgi:DNA ligase-1
MKASPLEDVNVLRFPVMASPKVDGIRCLIVDGVPKTQKLLDLPNHYAREFLSTSRLTGMDGELVVGLPNSPTVFNKTTRGVMTREGTPQVTFHVFDRWDSSDTFVSRWANLPSAIDLDGMGVRVRRLIHRPFQDLESLLAYEESCVAAGYEGIMVRDPNGPYKFGRSTPREGWLWKVKRFQDSEAEILGVIEQVHNGNEAKLNNLGLMKRSSHKANRVPTGTTGKIQCRDIHSGVEFNIGTGRGMDDATRAEWWANPPVGRIIKYRFQLVGVLNKPRIPSYLGFRED